MFFLSYKSGFFTTLQTKSAAACGEGPESDLHIPPQPPLPAPSWQLTLTDAQKREEHPSRENGQTQKIHQPKGESTWVGVGGGAPRLLFEKCQETRTVPGDRLQTDGQFGKGGFQTKGHRPQKEPHTYPPGDTVSVWCL